MTGACHLYRRYLGVSLRGQMQYRASFLLLALGELVGTAIEFAGIWALFSRFGNLRSWRLPEVALFYGAVHVAYALGAALATGFDTFDQLVKSGDFDRLLLRPRSTVLQLAGQDLALRRLGRFTQGLIVLVWAGSALHLPWTPGRLGLLVAAIAGAACLFYGLIVLQATLAFWTIESLEVMNILTYGGVETASFPLAIYERWFRRFFTFAVPLGCVCYYPMLAVLDKPDPWGAPAWVGWVSPLAGVLFLLLALRIWRLGVRHYCSTGH
jgi:ABC-2 type transport system permease protein